MARPSATPRLRSCPTLQGKSVEFSCRIHHFRRPLVLRVADEDLAEYPKEIRPLDPELVLRQVPGKSVQRSTYPQRRRHPRRPRPSLNPPRREVVRVRRPPRRLRPRPPPPLAFVARTRSLSISDPRVRSKPLPANAARAATGARGHPSPSTRLRRPRERHRERHRKREAYRPPRLDLNRLVIPSRSHYRRSGAPLLPSRGGSFLVSAEGVVYNIEDRKRVVDVVRVRHRRDVYR